MNENTQPNFGVGHRPGFDLILTGTCWKGVVQEPIPNGRQFVDKQF